MAGEWQRLPLPEVAEFQEGPGIMAVDFRDTGVPLLRLRNIEGAFVDLNGCNYLDPNKVSERWPHFRLRVGDLLISTSASLGRVSEVTDAASGSIAYTGIIRFRPRQDAISHDYLRVWLGSREFMEQAEAVAAGSVIRHFGPSHLKGMWISLPPLKVQEATGEIGRVLDDKIELNRVQAKTLEAMAKALFKSWFIDFDPVHAKEEGQPTGLPDGAANLFPSCFNADGIPEGWSSEPVLNQAEWVNGAAYKDMHFSDAPDALPVIKIAELKNGLTRTTKRTNTDLGDRYRIRAGELLFSWSGSPGTSIDTFIWIDGEAWLNQHIFAVRPNGNATRAYLFAMLKFLKDDLIEIARNKQTTGLGHVTRQDLNRIQVHTGGAAILAAFEAAVGPIYEKLQTVLNETHTLVVLRNTLLPKLISGELRISDAEAQVSAA